MKFVLHTGITSSSSWRVRICLALKGIPYETVTYDSTVEGAAKNVSLSGQVPVLQVDDLFLSQSVAICEYLDELFPHPPLLHLDHVKRAKIRELVQVVNSGIQPLQNQSLVRRVSSDPAKQAQWSRYHIEKGLAVLERAAERNASSDVSLFSFATTPTLADVYLVPQVANALRNQVDMSKFPRLLRIFTTLMQNEPAVYSTSKL